MQVMQTQTQTQTQTQLQPRDLHDLIRPKFISRELFDSYKTREAPFSVLGRIVYLRTYSRYVPELKRREKWCETVLRVVEYSIGLVFSEGSKEAIAEAEDLYDVIFNMEAFPAGRTLFTGGTKISELHGSSQFNCCFVQLDCIKSFVDTFYMLMNGAGVGFSTEKLYIEKLPKFNPCKLVNLEYNGQIKYPIENSTRAIWNDVLYITVGDSKEGWAKALQHFLEGLSERRRDPIRCVVINYDNVRPAGARLKTFGGRASGPYPLMGMFEEIMAILHRCNGVLDSVGALDLENSIAKVVVVGGVRRSSEIALGDANDLDFIRAKENLWEDPAKEPYRSTRVMSNNSVMLWEKPTREQLAHIFTYIRNNGEPAFYIAGNAKKRRADFKGTNPCGEILLTAETRAGSTCNLTEIVLSAFVEDGVFNMGRARRAIYHATRMGSRITTVKMWDPDWDRIQKRDRLLGVSLTGQVEAWNLMGISSSSTEAASILRELGTYARQVADSYHEELGIPRSLLVTTGKPSGTISSVAGVSSGCHAPYAPYYFRRVRISKSDPLAKALVALGLVPVPENEEGDDLHSDRCTTWVFKFPIKTSAPIRSIDEPALDQLNRYKTLMDNYVEHNQSVTITVAPHEWDSVVDWLDEPSNYESCVGISFLPRFDPAEGNGAYPNMPFETCTREQYEELAQQIGAINEEALVGWISHFEVDYDEYGLDTGCSTGACPVR